LFGPASLFQLLNTARTQAGEDTLASWLSAGADIAEVRARQGAVSELSSKVDFREDLAVLAAESDVGRTNALLEWGATPPTHLSRAVGMLFAVCAAVSASLVVLVLTERVPLIALVIWALVQSGIVRIWRKP